MLNDHEWTGNVRELRNTVESIVAMSSNSATIGPEHLHLEGKKAAFNGPPARDHDEGKKLQYVVQSINKEMIRIALQKANWNKTRAAIALGISRASLNRRIEKYNISEEVT